MVLGYQQSEVVEDLYSPVAKVQTLRLMLLYCCQPGLEIGQLDVKIAFLNDRVKSDVFVRQPLGYADGTDKFGKLRKALYGLRENSRDWYECLGEFL